MFGKTDSVAMVHAVRAKKKWRKALRFAPLPKGGLIRALLLACGVS